MSEFLPESSMLQLINWSIRFSVLPSFLFQEKRQLFFLSWCCCFQLHHCEQQRNLALGTFHDYWRNKEPNWVWELNGLKFNLPSNQQGQTGVEYLYLNRKQILLLFYQYGAGGEEAEIVSVALGTKRWLLFFFPTVKLQHFHIPETAVVIIWTVSKVHHVEQIHLDFLFSLPAS